MTAEQTRQATVATAARAASMALALVADVGLAEPSNVELDPTGVVLWFDTVAEFHTWTTWLGEHPTHVTDTEGRHFLSLTTDLYDADFTLCVTTVPAPAATAAPIALDDAIAALSAYVNLRAENHDIAARYARDYLAHANGNAADALIFAAGWVQQAHEQARGL